MSSRPLFGAAHWERESCSRRGNVIFYDMRVIAPSVIVDFWDELPETKASLERWYRLTRAAHWTSTEDVQKAAPKAKVLNRDRVRFEIAGGNYRLVVAF